MTTHFSILSHGQRGLAGCSPYLVLPSNRPATPLFSPACWELGFQARGFHTQLDEGPETP